MDLKRLSSNDIRKTTIPSNQKKQGSNELKLRNRKITLFDLYRVDKYGLSIGADHLDIEPPYGYRITSFKGPIQKKYSYTNTFQDEILEKTSDITDCPFSEFTDQSWMPDIRPEKAAEQIESIIKQIGKDHEPEYRKGAHVSGFLINTCLPIEHMKTPRYRKLDYDQAILDRIISDGKINHLYYLDGEYVWKIESDAYENHLEINARQKYRLNKKVPISGFIEICPSKAASLRRSKTKKIVPRHPTDVFEHNIKHRVGRKVWLHVGLHIDHNSRVPKDGILQGFYINGRRQQSRMDVRLDDNSDYVLPLSQNYRTDDFEKPACVNVRLEVPGLTVNIETRGHMDRKRLKNVIVEGLGQIFTDPVNGPLTNKMYKLRKGGHEEDRVRIINHIADQMISGTRLTKNKPMKKSSSQHDASVWDLMPRKHFNAIKQSNTLNELEAKEQAVYSTKSLTDVHSFIKDALLIDVSSLIKDAFKHYVDDKMRLYPSIRGIGVISALREKSRTIIRTLGDENATKFPQHKHVSPVLRAITDPGAWRYFEAVKDKVIKGTSPMIPLGDKKPSDTKTFAEGDRLEVKQKVNKAFKLLNKVIDKIDIQIPDPSVICGSYKGAQCIRNLYKHTDGTFPEYLKIGNQYYIADNLDIPSIVSVIISIQIDRKDKRGSIRVGEDTVRTWAYGEKIPISPINAKIQKVISNYLLEEGDPS